MTTTLEFDKAPGAARAYLRAVLGAGKPRVATVMPALSAIRRKVRIDAGEVARCRLLFGLDAEGQVPPTFAHMLAAPLQLALLTHPSFPVRVLGTVHLSNPINQQRALRAGEQVDLIVRMLELRQVTRGIEHDMSTEVYDNQGQLVWQGTSTNFLRQPATADMRRLTRPAPAEVAPAPDWQRAWSLALDAGLGRRYARLSGDWNPIHVSAPSAKLFGFRRAVAHGMWTYGKVLALLEPHLPGDRLSIDIQFRRPLYLPGRAMVRASVTSDQDCWHYVVEDLHGTTLHAEGLVMRMPVGI